MPKPQGNSTRTAAEQATIARVTQATAAAVLATSTGSLRALIDAPRLPDGRYDLRTLVPWFVARKLAEQAGADPLLSAGDNSPSLERYRAARAGLAELELEQRRGTLVRLEGIQGGLLRLAGMLRGCGERLGRRFGSGAQELMSETLDEFEKAITRDEKAGGTTLQNSVNP